MQQTDYVVQAAKWAIERAARRGQPEVTPDDLLLALLRAHARFDVLLLGPWTIDLAPWLAPVTEAPTRSAPRYADETVAQFDRASAIAQQDHSGRVEIVHMLVAYAAVNAGLMGELKQTHTITPALWRAALARWDPLVASTRQEQTGSGRDGPPLLSTEEAAGYLGVHPQTVRTYIRTGKLSAFRLAGERKIRIRREDLTALLERVSPDDDLAT